MRIVVHPSDRSDFENSVFATELRLISNAGSVDIACPYLGVDFLDELTRSVSKFRLVTDAEEWLRAFPRSRRGRIVDFIVRFQPNVRHFRNVHAKVAISKRGLFFGSANFTKRGLFEREEFSAIVEAETLVSTARDWFESVWDRASTIAIADIERYEASLPDTGLGAGGPPRVLAPPKGARTGSLPKPARTPRTGERELIVASQH